MASTADRTTYGPGNTWGWTMGCGIVLALAGILSLAAPGFTTVAITVLLGWVLLFTGIAGIAMGLRSHSTHRRWIDILYGGASLLIALFILFDPVAGAASLTLAFGVWLAFRGIVELAGASRAAPGHLRNTLILVGVIDVVLALLLFFNFPFPAVQALGAFVGISLLLGGIVTMLAAYQLRRMTA